MEVKTTVDSNSISKEQGHQDVRRNSKEAHEAKEHTNKNRQPDHTVKPLSGDDRINKHEMRQQSNVAGGNDGKMPCAAATETSRNSDKIVCEYCRKLVERNCMENHHREECEKADRPRVQTSTHTIKVLSAQDKIENPQEKLIKNLQEQQQVTEQRLQEQQQVTEQRLQEQQQVTEQRLQEQQEVTEQKLQEQQQVTEQRLREQQQITEQRLQEQQEVTEQKLQEQQQVTEQLQEQQQVTEQRLQEQQQVTERLQRENKTLLNELNGVIKDQRRNHSQVWVIIITMVVALLLALVLAVGLSQEQTVTQQEFVSITQALKKSVAEIEQSIQMTRADKETLKDRLEVQETTFSRSVYELEQKITLLREILCPGSHAIRPASSCQEILNYNPSSSSGYYWIASADGNATEMYCSMNKTCGEASGGWMRVAELDMRNRGSQCPSGLEEREHPDYRLCAKDTYDGDCSHVTFKISNVSYDRVCGKIIAYQYGALGSFYKGNSMSRSIDKSYLDGISLTYSRNPRKHIWSFAAALDEVGSVPEYNCPCINITLAEEATPPPDFVGNDYFCDTGSTNKYEFYHLYVDNPLWDGVGCGPDNTCCSLNNPPWFFKQLPSSTSEDIEMRVCCDRPHFSEDIYIQIELYVH